MATGTPDVTVTVVTPTLDAERYVADCLASVREQRAAGVDVEHLVVDGGSHDATERLCREAGATWLVQSGRGQAGAINDGFRAARGEVLAWLNADDEYVGGALRRVAGLFGAQPDLDVVYGDCEVVDATGAHLWWEQPGGYDFDRLLRSGNYIAQPAVFLRRRVLAAVGELDETLHYAMDYDLWLRLRRQVVRYVPEPLARFRWHGASKSANHPLAAWRENLAVVRRHGGGWTPQLAWSFGRCLASVLRDQASGTRARPRRGSGYRAGREAWLQKGGE